MITSEKILSELLAYGVTLLFVMYLSSHYGKQAIEWFLMKLYDFLVWLNAMES
ncbi:MAG: hypothetical protein Q8891_12280 [Bacteroidota bacterium]|nr:hypothetical protein [Bacteroidota bacterium]